MTPREPSADAPGTIADLIELLGRERELLTTGQVDGKALGAIAAAKQQALAALQPAPAGTRSPAEAATATPGASARRRRLLQDAARMNRFNGHLIQLRMAANQRLLNGLRALAGAGLYGPDGQAHAGQRRVAARA